MADRLLVLLFGDVIGVLERANEGDDPTFTYDAAYAAQGEVALSARLPIRREGFGAPRVAPYLAGLLPENPQTRAIWAARLDSDAEDAFAMLAQMGWDCPGAVQFCRPRELDALRARAGDFQEVNSSDIAQRLRNREQPASWTMPRGPEGNGVAPLYDVATGLSYDATTIERSIALSIGGERQLSRIGPKQWRKAADILTIDIETLEGRVAYLADSYPPAFERALADVADAPRASEVADRALPAVAAHCAKILDSLSGYQAHRPG